MKRIKIKKGHHRCYCFWPKVYRFNRPLILSEWYRFDDTAFFNLFDEDQWDVNKLMGLSSGNHHKNSCRFGWRPLLNEHLIEIVAYEYHNGERQPTKYIHKIEADKWYNYRIMIGCDGAVSYTILDINNNPLANWTSVLYLNCKFGYKLNPYFGGNEVAPQDIIIYKKNEL